MPEQPAQLTDLMKHIVQRFPDAQIPPDLRDFTQPFFVVNAQGTPVVRILPPNPENNPFWRWQSVPK